MLTLASPLDSPHPYLFLMTSALLVPVAQLWHQCLQGPVAGAWDTEPVAHLFLGLLG